VGDFEFLQSYRQMVLTTEHHLLLYFVSSLTINMITSLSSHRKRGV
jgi:hypothetical protein